MLESISSAVSDQAVMVMLTLLSLVAVWVPFTRGLRLCVAAWRATERLSSAELTSKSVGRKRKGVAEPMSLLMMRVLRKSMRQNESSDQYPSDFIFDAAHQYVMHEYSSHYSSLISMYASLLPPLGFVGTTGGMLILFISMHLSNSALELGALAVALISSVFALVAFSVLEGLKVKVYRRLLLCLSDVQELFEQVQEA